MVSINPQSPIINHQSSIITHRSSITHHRSSTIEPATARNREPRPRPLGPGGSFSLGESPPWGINPWGISPLGNHPPGVSLPGESPVALLETQGQGGTWGRGAKPPLPPSGGRQGYVHMARIGGAVGPDQGAQPNSSRSKASGSQFMARPHVILKHKPPCKILLISTGGPPGPPVFL